LVVGNAMNIETDGSQGLNRVQERQVAERAYHDRQYGGTGEGRPAHYRVHPTYPVFLRMLDIMGDRLAGGVVLEYGCGAGWVTAELAARGGRVSAFDISPEAIARAATFLEKNHLLDACNLRVMAGERLEYPDGAFDLAVGFAVLHHLELPVALPELHRVLKPGGLGVFAEPLGSNPLINVYRRLTPRYRSPDERPIDLPGFARQVTRFRRFSHHPQLITAAAASALAYVPGLTRAAKPTQSLLQRLDDVLLRAVPSVGGWAWYSVLVLEK